MDGPSLIVQGKFSGRGRQHDERGKIVIHGSAGDITGYAMRGGKYTSGTMPDTAWDSHEGFNEFFPAIIIGGRAGNFLGEYMAGA